MIQSDDADNKSHEEDIEAGSISTIYTAFNA